MPEQIISASGPQYGLVVNPDGSINVSGVDISIGSLALSLENVYVQSGDNINLGTAWTGVGSVVISGTSIPPWRGIGSVTGNVGVSGAKLDNLAGSVGVTALPATLGSVYIKSGVVGVSGTYFQNMLGSVAITNQYLGSKTWVIDTAPNVADRSNPQYKFEYIISGTATGVIGSSIGSITMFIGAGSYVSKWSYDNNNLVSIGSYI